MTVTIKKGADKKTIDKQLKRLGLTKSKKSGVDTRKYCGTIKFREDGLALQKKWRGEWN